MEQDGRRHSASTFLSLQAMAVHVRGRPANVGDDAGEALGLVADGFDLAHHGGFRAVLDDAAFVLGDEQRCSAAEAAAHDCHGKAIMSQAGIAASPLGGMGCARA